MFVNYFKCFNNSFLPFFPTRIIIKKTRGARYGGGGNMFPLHSELKKKEWGRMGKKEGEESERSGYVTLQSGSKQKATAHTHAYTNDQCLPSRRRQST